MPGELDKELDQLTNEEIEARRGGLGRRQACGGTAFPRRQEAGPEEGSTVR
jgi:hypothetical protein